MAQWSRNKVDSSTINSGNEYERQDRVSRQNLNAMVNSGLYAQDFAEALADTPDVSDAGVVGTPTVTLIDNIKNGKTYKKFKFSNLKGATGPTGPGVPSGGSFGMYLRKASSTPYDTEWQTPDSSVIQGSTNLVTGGGVYNAISAIGIYKSNVNDVIETMDGTFDPNNYYGTWTLIGRRDTICETSWHTLSSGTCLISYIRRNGIVSIQYISFGDVTLAGGVYNNIATLPTGYRPSAQQNFSINYIGGPYVGENCFVETGGDVKVFVAEPVDHFSLYGTFMVNVDSDFSYIWKRTA